MTARFVGYVDLRVLEDNDVRPVYQLLNSFRFYSEEQDCEYEIPRGILTDGPSIPALLAPLVGSVSLGLRAAVVHDYLVHEESIEREVADKVFLEALRVCGVDDNAAQTMYYAVSAYTAQLKAEKREWSSNQPPYGSNA